MNPGNLFSELKRRRVWRVAGGYVLVVWMAVEIVVETFPLLGAPDWVPRLVVVLAFVGFPVTVILAWLFDITPEGVVRTRSLGEAADPEAESERPEPPQERVLVQAGPARLAGVFGAGILVALVGFGAYSMVNPGALVRPESIQSIAVLPFADLSPGQDQGYFADGVTEELINRLARLQEVRVAGRASSFAFRGRDPGLDEISNELGVEAVVEGSLRRDGDQLRVTVQLVDVASGFQIWSNSYDRTVDDIFAIQDDIASAIVDALRVQLVPGASRLRAGTSNVRAHDAYLLGLARWHARTENDLRRALEYFEEAVEEDASYAPAHAGMALTYAVLPAYTDMPVDEAAELGSAAAARALALNAQMAEAHTAIGRITQSLEWNLDAAEMAYTRAIQFQPNYATAHQWYAEALIMMGRLAEAEQELERAERLDPLSVATRYTRGYLWLARRDLRRARTAYETLLADNPGDVLGQANLLFLCLAADCHDQAITAARAAYPPAVADAIGAVVRADADPSLREEARAALRELEGTVSPTHLALLHSAIGDRDGALDRLEEAYAEGADPMLPFFLVHPLFDPVRRDPRFDAVANALGVETPLAGLDPSSTGR
ncbi:MAG: tetratricopeptide repeat protein [Longimicrobiales bacterium]